MAKYHINSAGEPGECQANAGNCPFGGEANHYPSAENARAAYEFSNASLAMPAGLKKDGDLHSEMVTREGGRLRPTEEVEGRVNRWPSCYGDAGDAALREGTASMYEWAASQPRRVADFEAKAEAVFATLEKEYLEEGISDTEPRGYWHDHMDEIRRSHGWAVSEW